MLSCFWQAVLALRWFRDRTACDALARDHGISRATAYRYLDEIITVLAEQAPELSAALKQAKDAGFSHVILDGKVIPCDRCKEPTVSVKGEVLRQGAHPWRQRAGGVRPGRVPAVGLRSRARLVHDLTAARAQALPALYPGAAYDLPTLADPGYEGAGISILIPARQPPGGGELDVNNRTRNAIQRSLRCLGERGFALLNQRWRALQDITASPSKIGTIARAATVLTHFEHDYTT